MLCFQSGGKYITFLKKSKGLRKNIEFFFRPKIWVFSICLDFQQNRGEIVPFSLEKYFSFGIADSDSVDEMSPLIR